MLLTMVMLTLYNYVCGRKIKFFCHKMSQLFSFRENSFALLGKQSVNVFLFLILIVNLSMENNKAQNNIFSDIYL